MSEATHLFYKNSRFKTKLPRNRKYLKSHYWISNLEDDQLVLRIGFTKFSVRMLGEMVETDYEVKAGHRVELGEVIGWIEGFKATSDVYAVAEGEFLGYNKLLRGDPEIFFKKPYEEGWLYQIKGESDSESMNVEAYAAYLDETIEKMQGVEA